MAAHKGAGQVVGTDILESAVQNARLNVQRLRLETVIEIRDPGDLFEPVRGERFDVVIFNPPWIVGEAKTVYDKARYDSGQEILARFMKEAPSHLVPDGRIYLIYSNASRPTDEDFTSYLSKLATDNGLLVTNDWYIHKPKKQNPRVTRGSPSVRDANRSRQSLTPVGLHIRRSAAWQNALGRKWGENAPALLSLQTAKLAKTPRLETITRGKLHTYTDPRSPLCHPQPSPRFPSRAFLRTASNQLLRAAENDLAAISISWLLDSARASQGSR